MARLHDGPIMTNGSNHSFREGGDRSLREYVTAVIGGQLVGMPIGRVQDVFLPERTTRVPLAPAEIAGVLNLRGRIVTLIDLRERLGLPPREDDGVSMAVGIEVRGESYGLLVDSVGEVHELDDSAREPNPMNLDPRLARVSAGIHRLDGELLMLIDVESVLDIGPVAVAA